MTVSAPQQVASYLALVAVSLSVGYWAGSTLKSPTLTTKPHATPSSLPTLEADQKDEQHSGDESDSDVSSEEGEDVSSLKVDPADDCKLVLVVRTDLGMSSGKIAAQCSHATLACYKTLQSSNRPLLRQWERNGQTKVALRCSDEEELLLLQAQAQSLNLCARSIQDAGRTQIAAGSRTVLGIAGPTKLVNQITGALRLL